MIHIRTGSRLHFGLLAVPQGDPPGDFWPNHEGQDAVPARRFGGVGLMIEKPSISLTVAPAREWIATGPASSRALEFAQRFARSLPPHFVKPHSLEIHECAPEHAGLGTGTQLGLAVARALNLESGLRRLDAMALAGAIGRGQRSAVGIHGFDHGGLLVDGGKRETTAIAPLVVRLLFPESWRIILAIPKGDAGRHGSQETQLFEQLLTAPSTLRTTEALSRLVLLGLLPALVEMDYPAFAEALFDFNARSGEHYAPVQQCIYSSALAAELVHELRTLGVAAAGQSSWGPTVFGVVEDDERAALAAEHLRSRFTFDEDEVFVTAARNSPAIVG